MVGSEDFFKDKNDEFSGASGPSFGDSNTDRNKMIEILFKRVLGRKPSSRELAYYKYSAVSEDEIVKKLLTGDEHKKILKDYKELPDVKERLLDSENEMKKLSKRFEDFKGEVSQLRVLLDEKSREIKNLREELKNPYDLPNKLEKYEEGFDNYNKVRVQEDNRKKTFIDKMDEIFDILLRR